MNTSSSFTALVVATLARVFDRPSVPDSLKSLDLRERVVEEGFDGIVILDSRNGIVRLNGNARRLLNLTKSQAIDEPIDRWLPRAMVEEVRAARRSPTTNRYVPTIRETEVRHDARDVRHLEFTITPIEIEDGVAESHLCVTLRDITDRRRATEHIQNMAMRDSLTGVLNRRGLWEAFTDRRAEVGDSASLIYLDLDKFKSINDGLGHRVGDELLVQVAKRASGCLTGGGLLARLGGDEFAAVTFGSADDARSYASAILEELGRPFLVFGHQVSIGTSIGFVTNQHSDLAWLMQKADVALYDAKSRGGQRITVYHPSLEQDRRDREVLEQEMREAIDRGEMYIVYQPQVLVSSGDVIGVEALLRWRHPKRGLVPPSLFIPIAEETGFIHSLTEWLVNRACAEAALWPAKITLAVNVSPVDLQSGDVPQLVSEALSRSGLSPGRLELEITETAFLRGGEAVEDAFNKVRELGVEFALDDFGTGYSSLAYLHRYPFAKLKIDRSFISGIPRDQQAMTILRSIIMLAQGLGMRSIAEGVETDEQRETLRLLGCQHAQGYLFSKPMDNASLTRLLNADRLYPPEMRQRFNAAG